MLTLEKIRRYMPDVFLRTSLYSGFPGETKQMHDECVEFVKEVQFDRLGVFPYSAEEGTPAASYDGQVPEETKRAYADEIMEASQYVIFQKNEKMVGRTFRVMVDGFLPEENIYVGRTYGDAPEVDGCIFFECVSELVSGTIVPVQITDAKGYDLMGVIVSERRDEE